MVFLRNPEQRDEPEITTTGKHVRAMSVKSVFRKEVAAVGANWPHEELGWTLCDTLHHPYRGTMPHDSLGKRLLRLGRS